MQQSRSNGEAEAIMEAREPAVIARLHAGEVLPDISGATCLIFAASA